MSVAATKRPPNRRLTREPKYKNNQLISFWPERLSAAIAASETSVNALARHLRIKQQTLNSMLRGRPKRSRAKTVAKLARALGVTIDWLGGSSNPLPGATLRQADGLPVLRSTLGSILRALDDPTSAGVRLADALSFAIAFIERPDTLGLVSMGLSANANDLLAALKTIQSQGGDGAHVSFEAATIEEHYRALPALAPTPAKAQLAEHRLKQACYDAWRRQVRKSQPDFEPSGLPADPEVWKKEPGRSLGLVMAALDKLLSPDALRARLLRGEKSEPVTAAELDRTVPSLVTALGAVLAPWLDGDADLDYRALANMAGLPDPSPGKDRTGRDQLAPNSPPRKNRRGKRGTVESVSE